MEYPPRNKQSLSTFSSLKNQESVAITGRIVFLRDLGKLVFAKACDFGGVAQFSLSSDNLPNFLEIKKDLSLGDFVNLQGTTYTTKAGELTLSVEEIQILGRSQKSLPDKWHGLQDEDLKVRYKYLDLIQSVEEKKRFKDRFKILNSIRLFLGERGFVEVETPILQATASGAAANPFKTHYKALDESFYLRIAPELFLKRLLVAGFPKVFEMGKCFRNEGIDRTHLQEFTMLEFYEAYISYEELMDRAVELLQHIVRQLNADLVIEDLDFNHIRRISYQDFIQENIGFKVDSSNMESAASILGLDPKSYGSSQALMDAIYKKGAVLKTFNPTLVFDYPRSPLAKVSSKDDRFSDQFQIIMRQQEIVKACLEQNDPDQQEKAFLEQKKHLDSGDEEAVRTDMEFIEALKYGMPPSGGLGLGIDRLVTILTGAPSIRHSILFPICKSIR